MTIKRKREAQNISTQCALLYNPSMGGKVNSPPQIKQLQSLFKTAIHPLINQLVDQLTLC